MLSLLIEKSTYYSLAFHSLDFISMVILTEGMVKKLYAHFIVSLALITYLRKVSMDGFKKVSRAFQVE